MTEAGDTPMLAAARRHAGQMRTLLVQLDALTGRGHPNGLRVSSEDTLVVVAFVQLIKDTRALLADINRASVALEDGDES